MKDRFKEELKKEIEKFLEEIYDELVEALQKGRKSIVLNFGEIEKRSFKLAEAILKDPKTTIRLIEDAIRSIKPPSLKELGIGRKEEIRVRFTELPPSCYHEIRNLRSVHIGKLIVIEGIIKTASDVRPIPKSFIYKCDYCGKEWEFEVEPLTKPPRNLFCKICKRLLPSKPIREVLRDAQRLIVEEIPERVEGQPRRVDVLLLDDLVDPFFQRYVIPGRRIRIIGILKKTKVRGKEMYEYLIEANNIEALEAKFEEEGLTEEDIKEIKKLSELPDLEERIINSIAPSIAGYREIKEAIMLQLFGGVEKKRPDGTKTRGLIHILLVGDPGVGKSQILKHVAAIAPRATYVSGKGITGPGISATVVRDEILGGWCLEAGPLVLMSGGLLCVDELDQVRKEDIAAFHEALEQNTISIAKANIHAVLKAETSVLAAANPKFGRFDPYRPIPEQINLPPTLINRFDLIFPLRDIPDKEKDKYVAEFMLKSHMNPEEKKPQIPYDLLKKYIIYARKYCRPKLTEEAMKEIKDFYLTLRGSVKPGDEGMKPIPISPRQLEALIRMSEAYAKVRLKEKVEREDALKAIRLMKYFLREVGLEPGSNAIDIDRIMTGIPASKRDKIGRIMEMLERLSREYENRIPLNTILMEAEKAGIEKSETLRILDELKRVGEIYSPEQGKIALL